jgi:hypothetical protein
MGTAVWLVYIELTKYSTSYQILMKIYVIVFFNSESGDLDAYWLNHFELLIDLGWIS